MANNSGPLLACGIFERPSPAVHSKGFMEIHKRYLNRVNRGATGASEDARQAQVRARMRTFDKAEDEGEG